MAYPARSMQRLLRTMRPDVWQAGGLGSGLGTRRLRLGNVRGQVGSCVKGQVIRFNCEHFRVYAKCFRELSSDVVERQLILMLDSAQQHEQGAIFAVGY